MHNSFFSYIQLFFSRFFSFFLVLWKNCVSYRPESPSEPSGAVDKLLVRKAKDSHVDHYPVSFRNSSEPLVLNCYVSPPCKFLLRKNGGLTALFTFSYVTCGSASDCAEQLPSDYLNRTKVKRSSADFGREGSAVEIDDFEKDIPHWAFWRIFRLMYWRSIWVFAGNSWQQARQCYNGISNRHGQIPWNGDHSRRSGNAAAVSYAFRYGMHMLSRYGMHMLLRVLFLQACAG